MKLVYIGSEGRRLVATGLAVEVRSALAEVEGSADVVVVDAPSVTMARMRFPGAKVVARVGRREDVPLALAKADDVVVDGEDLAELTARALSWSRVAVDERKATARNEALARRVRALEASLADLSRRHAAIAEQARTDELTGLGNRRSFSQALSFGLELSARYGGALSVVLCGIDGLQQVNDAFGNAAGDVVLGRVADVLRASLRAVDHPARLGGDELGIVMPSTRAADAAAVADRIRDRIEALLCPGGLALTASLGVASWRGTRGSTVAEDDLLQRADAALYEAKRTGNRVRVDAASAERAA